VNTGAGLKTAIIIEERGRLGSEGRAPDGSVLLRDVISLMSEQACSAVSIQCPSLLDSVAPDGNTVSSSEVWRLVNFIVT
jgi:hypothetical protein